MARIDPITTYLGNVTVGGQGKSPLVGCNGILKLPLLFINHPHVAMSQRVAWLKHGSSLIVL